VAHILLEDTPRICTNLHEYVVVKMILQSRIQKLYTDFTNAMDFL